MSDLMSPVLRVPKYRKLSFWDLAFVWKFPQFRHDMVHANPGVSIDDTTLLNLYFKKLEELLPLWDAKKREATKMEYLMTAKMLATEHVKDASLASLLYLASEESDIAVSDNKDNDNSDKEREDEDTKMTDQAVHDAVAGFAAHQAIAEATMDDTSGDALSASESFLFDFYEMGSDDLPDEDDTVEEIEARHQMDKAVLAKELEKIKISEGGASAVVNRYEAGNGNKRIRHDDDDDMDVESRPAKKGKQARDGMGQLTEGVKVMTVDYERQSSAGLRRVIKMGPSGQLIWVDQAGRVYDEDYDDE